METASRKSISGRRFFTSTFRNAVESAECCGCISHEHAKYAPMFKAASGLRQVLQWLPSRSDEQLSNPAVATFARPRVPFRPRAGRRRVHSSFCELYSSSSHCSLFLCSDAPFVTCSALTLRHHSVNGPHVQSAASQVHQLRDCDRRRQGDARRLCDALPGCGSGSRGPSLRRTAVRALRHRASRRRQLDTPACVRRVPTGAHHCAAAGVPADGALSELRGRAARAARVHWRGSQ
jgi:hypothetical protein